MTSIANRVAYKFFVAALLFLSGLAGFQAQALNEPTLKPSGISWFSYASTLESQGATQNKSKADAAKKTFEEAEQLRSEGSAESLKRALEKYDEALLLYRSISDRGGEVLTLYRIGQIYSNLGERRKALVYYTQALPLVRAVGDRAGEAMILNNIGTSHQRLGEIQKALTSYNQALSLSTEMGDRPGEATALGNIATAHDDLGEKQKALDYYNQALILRRAVGDRNGEASTLHNIGTAYSDLGQKKKALDYYNQALPLRREVGDRIGEAETLNNIGAAYDDLGEKEKALDYYNQALLLKRVVGDRDGEANTLSNMGTAYSDLGEKEKALGYYSQALSLRRALDDRIGQAVTLSNIGAVYGDLGENKKALDYYNQALPLRRAVGDRIGEAATLNNIGTAYGELGERKKSLDYFNQALTLQREVGARYGEAVVLNNIGFAYKELRENRKALEYFDQALTLLRAVGNRATEAVTLGNIGLLYDALGEKQKALDYYNQALLLSRAVADRGDEATILTNLMSSWKDNNPSLAIFYGKQAVNTLQQLRANIHGLEKELQRTFLRSREDTYRELANLLISRGRLPEAQQVLGLLKEQEYFEFVRRDASVSALLQRSDLTPAEEAAVNRYNEIADQITKLAGEFSTLKAGGASPTDARYQTLKADLEAANRTFQVLLRQLSDEFGKESEKAKGVVKDLQENKGLQSDLKRWGGGTVSLYTVVGEENYHVILTTPTLQVARQANPAIKAVDLNKLILQFREAIQDPKVDPRPLAQQLYKILIAPVEKDLEAAGAKTLVWSLDGTLRYLPVAALHDGQLYVVERYQNVIITLASRTRLNDQPSKDWHGLGLGVSKGVVKEWGTFGPLPSVPAELRGIIREANQSQLAAGILPGRIMLDQIFTEQAMERALGEGLYPLVHIASHFQFKPGNETNSFLLLGDGNRLTLDKIRVSASPFFDGVELLTLSACDTATGGDANGKEVEGFAVLAQEQGAQAVVATLWSVADESTKLLMEKFYKYHAAKPGTTKVESLRQAQLALLRPQDALRGAGTNGHQASSAKPKSPTLAFIADPKAPYAHPYFWAPFILIGNWR